MDVKKSRSPSKKSPEEKPTSPRVEELSSLPLHEFPIDILRLLMAELTTQEAQYLCSSNAKLREKCRRHDLVNVKAREYVMQQSPLSQPVYTSVDQELLLKRGFKTTYNFLLGRKTGEVEFGPLHAREDRNLQPVQFSIVGMPPPKGTKVLILYEKDLGDHVSSRLGSVFESLEDLYATFDDGELLRRDRQLEFFIDYMTDMYMTDIEDANPDSDQDTRYDILFGKAKIYLVEMLESDDKDDQFGLREVELP